MTQLRILFARVLGLFRRRREEHELAQEMRAHLEMLTEEIVRKGLSRSEARYAALRSFDGVEQNKESYRDQRGLLWLESFLLDVRYGLRGLARNPGFAAMAILTLALGIGANTAIFSLIDAVMLRSLPVQKPEELVEIQRLNPRTGNAANSFTNPMWEAFRAQQDIFSNVFAWGDDRFDLSNGGQVRNANSMYVSGNYFEALGVRSSFGRLISPADDQRGCPAVAVLSYGFWQENYGGAPSAAGSSISLDRHRFQIIGATAPGFLGTEVGHNFDVALPICASAYFDGKESRLDHHSWWWLQLMSRIKPQTSSGTLKAGMETLTPGVLAASLPQNWPATAQQNFLKLRLVTVPAAHGLSILRRQFKQPLNVLMAVVGLVLLIACANIASLMLARAAGRNKEIALRRALGASRTRLVRQLLTECLLVSSAGALLGLVFAYWAAGLLVRYISTARDHVFLNLAPDSRVLGFTAAIAILTGVMFGILPALRSTRASLTLAMKGKGDPEGRGRSQFSGWIVSGQVACSMVLLVCAGLFLRSFAKLITLDMGFDRNNVLLMHLNLETANVPPEQRPAVFEDLEVRLRALPGVVSASRSWNTPLTGYEWNQYIHPDAPNPPTGEASLAYFNTVSPTYFETLHMPLLAGRAFNKQDAKSTPPVAIVNQTLARQFFAGLDPIGRTFRKDEAGGKLGPPIEVVGLVKDSKYESLREDTYPTAFFPIAQITPGDGSEESFELRTGVRPSSLASQVSGAVASVNRGISVDFHTLAEQVADSLVQERLLALLSGFFGGLALLLAMIGLYGTLSYLVTQRQTEFGVRLALGAAPGSILRMVMRDMGVVLAGGLVAGVCISLATVQLLQNLLFNLHARDALTLLASAGTLAAAAFIAACLPAYRAAHVDPMVALREE